MKKDTGNQMKNHEYDFSIALVLGLGYAFGRFLGAQAPDSRIRGKLNEPVYYKYCYQFLRVVTPLSPQAAEEKWARSKNCPFSGRFSLDGHQSASLYKA